MDNNNFKFELSSLTVKNFDHPSIQLYLNNVANHNFPIYPKMLTDEYNSLFNQVPFYPKDSWHQKNRHVWTEEEIEKLYSEYFPLKEGQNSSEVASVFLLLVEYDSREATSYIKNAPDPVDLWHIGRIIKIGSQAFASNKFPLGATATYGDWVRFNPLDAIRANFVHTQNRPILLPDYGILELIQDPKLYVNV